jgi:hypothetical protein
MEIRKSKRTPFIFNYETTGSFICLRLDLYMSHVKIRILHQWPLAILNQFSVLI